MFASSEMCGMPYLFSMCSLIQEVLDEKNPALGGMLASCLIR